jgi:hypothetical protein
VSATLVAAADPAWSDGRARSILDRWGISMRGDFPDVGAGCSAHVRRVALLTMLLSLSGCAAWLFGDVGDLRLERIARVPRESAPASGFFSAREFPFPQYLEVSVSSTVDIGGMAEVGDLNIWTQQSFCDEADPSIVDEDGLFLLGPYFRGIPLPMGQSPEEEAQYQRAIASDRAGARHVYNLYLPVRDEPTPGQISGGHPPPPYDLAARPQAICLLIGGGNMVGGLFRSNMVVVPVAAVAAALRP